MINKLTEDMYKALLRVEWAGNDGNCKGSYCLVCRKGPSDGHGRDCVVGNAIDQYKTVQKARELLQPPPV